MLASNPHIFIAAVKDLIQGSATPVQIRSIDCARSIGVTERTLRRRFAEMGTSYRRYKDSLIFARISEFVSNGQNTIGPSVIVKRLVELGFSEERAARRWLQAINGKAIQPQQA